MNKSIEFNKTSNLFANIGIVGLYRISKKFLIRHKDDFPTITISDLSSNQLTISGEKLFEFLEEVYYFMGKEFYDTVTDKQKDENLNAYFDERKDDFVRFPKMNSYGLPQLLTNNAQGGTRNPDNSDKLSNLKKTNPKLAERTKKFFSDNKIKLLSKVYKNEPYTKITRLKVEEKYFQPGDKICPITGEGFKYLTEAKNISPFLAGLANFNSCISSSEKKVSLKAIYLIRFAPVLTLYSYQNSYDTLVCNLFNSNSLENIDYWNSTESIRPKEELSKINYAINFRLADFHYRKKDNEEFKIETTKDCVWQSEFSFMLLYTFYKNRFKTEFSEEQDTEEIDIFADSPLEKRALSLVSFRADVFASTMRPSFYEEYNQVKPLLFLLHLLENGKDKIPVKDIWRGLLLNSPLAANAKRNKKNYNRGKAIERQYRAKVCEHILNGKSIVPLIENLFFDAFKYLNAQEGIGYRNYKTLTRFLIIYENFIKTMEEDLQQWAINLGSSIGGSISNFTDGGSTADSKTNVRAGRKYIIDLRNARTLEQFLSAIERIMFKYGVSVKKELLQQINQNNFILIKQFAVISALNHLNYTLSKDKK